MVQILTFLDDLPKVLQKPPVDFGESIDFVDGRAHFEGLREVENPLRVRDGEFQPQSFKIDMLVLRRRRSNRNV